jgi:hypothetical protein
MQYLPFETLTTRIDCNSPIETHLETHQKET